MKRSEHFSMPLWFKLWAAFSALVGLTVVGVVIWAIVKLVTKYG